MAKILKECREVIFAPGENTYGLKIFVESWSDTDKGTAEKYWKYDLPDGVQVMGFTQDGKVIAIEEFQPGVGVPYLHLVGETLQKHERPPSESFILAEAARGLLEETGYEAASLVLLSSVLENSSKSNRLIYLVLARGCQKIKEGEKEINVRTYDPVDFWGMMLDYFHEAPDTPHGAGNTLKLMTLALDFFGLLKMEGGG